MSFEKKKVRTKFYIESLVIFLVTLTPFFLKFYDYFPGSGSTRETVSILGIEIGRNGFDSISTNVWFYSNKLIPLLLLTYWFFTSKNWWYHILLIPIATYAFQLFELMYSEDDIIDTENIWWLIPVCMVVIPFVYLIRIKLYDKYVNGIDIEAMEAELHSLKQKRLKGQNLNNAVTKAELPEVEYRSLSEWLNQELSTGRISAFFQRFQKK